MGRGKIIKAPYRSILYLAACALAVITLITLSVTSYAKYISARGSNGSAGVAGVGIDIFELREHKADVNPDFDNNLLYKLDLKTEITGNDVSYNALPGVNIPKDPFIRLKIDSEVSYTLYLKVTVGATYKDADGKEHETDFPTGVIYKLTDVWEPVKGEDGTYKYIVSADDSNNNYVFKAGEKYEYNDSKVIKILKDDLIIVRDSYRGYTDYTYAGATLTAAVSFTLKFEAYIRQVLS